MGDIVTGGVVQPYLLVLFMLYTVLNPQKIPLYVSKLDLAVIIPCHQLILEGPILRRPFPSNH